MSMTDNNSGHGSKSKKVARRDIAPFLLLLVTKNCLSISEMVSSESAQKVWAVLKKKVTLGLIKLRLNDRKIDTMSFEPRRKCGRNMSFTGVKYQSNLF